MSVNKTDLINTIAEKAELSKADAGRALDAFIEAVKKNLKKGDDVALVGFGTFTVRKRAARTGRNPQTGAAIEIPAGHSVKLTAGSKLKAAASGK